MYGFHIDGGKQIRMEQMNRKYPLYQLADYASKDVKVSYDTSYFEPDYILFTTVVSPNGVNNQAYWAEFIREEILDIEQYVTESIESLIQTFNIGENSLFRY